MPATVERRNPGGSGSRIDQWRWPISSIAGWPQTTATSRSSARTAVPTSSAMIPVRIVGNSPCSIAPVQHRYADKMIDLLGAKDYLIAAHALSLVFTVVTDN